MVPLPFNTTVQLLAPLTPVTLSVTLSGSLSLPSKLLVLMVRAVSSGVMKLSAWASGASLAPCNVMVRLVVSTLLKELVSWY